jgi:hypothetical protein
MQGWFTTRKCINGIHYICKGERLYVHFVNAMKIFDKTEHLVALRKQKDYTESLTC